MSYSEWIGIKLVVMQTHQLLIISYIHSTYMYVYVYVFVGVWIYDFYILCQGQYVGFGHIYKWIMLLIQVEKCDNWDGDICSTGVVQVLDIGCGVASFSTYPLPLDK